MRSAWALLCVCAVLSVIGGAHLAPEKPALPGDKADVGFATPPLKTTQSETLVAIADMEPIDFAKPCNIPFVMPGSPFMKPTSCMGCLATLWSSLSWMNRDMNIANPELAQYELAKSCMYVDQEYAQVCEYMYNVHGRHVVSLVTENHPPVHICLCLNLCDQADYTLFTNAFQSKPAPA
eukprot:gnl/Spiro4/22191_TR10927_c0_g1_i1.p1 gnl/Spiro4/22191_TR10927_c0_g1~~gnl/Spiro4/22191_TR10927_c0_g1_i1.p1  ORF type:complete len:179 (-),score=39.51 gnl/Spiro4/22191_TR10927_c0_g1_i1:58-594(-)